jgi:hypothetical protein
MRMVGPHGNPTANNLFAMVTALQHQTHVETHAAEPEVKRPSRQAIRHVMRKAEKGRSQARNENEKARMTTRKA